MAAPSKPAFTLADAVTINNGNSTEYRLDVGAAVKALVVVIGSVGHEVYLKLGTEVGGIPAFYSGSAALARSEGTCWVVDVAAVEQLGVGIWNNSGSNGTFTVEVMLGY
jgi:hypothetical protein